MLLHLFNTDGQNWRHFTALWDCPVVLPPANSGGGKATTRTSFRVNFNEDYSGSLRFDNAITGTPTSVALPVHGLFHVFKNEGERREQRGKHTQKDTGHWKRAVNCLNHCLFQKSFQMTEFMCCFFKLVRVQHIWSKVNKWEKDSSDLFEIPSCCIYVVGEICDLGTS